LAWAAGLQATAASTMTPTIFLAFMLI